MSDSIIVPVKRPYTNAPPVTVTLKTDAGFDGTGLLTRSQTNIDFTVKGAATPLKFDGADNQFPGATLSAGIDLLAEAKTPSAAMNDVVLTLTLSGGSKKNGPPVKTNLTAVQVTLDICEPRVDDKTEPVPLPTANAPAGPNPNDKFYLGRPLPEQTLPKIDERAMLIVKDVKPKGFKGKLELVADNDQIEIYRKEKPAKDKAVAMPVALSPSSVGAKGFQFFIEGAKVSPSPRNTGVALRIKGVPGELDKVSISVCHTEIVSNRKPADVKTVAIVPEKPERKTNSVYFVAPIIVGLEYPVELRPYIEKAVPSAFQWSTPSDKVVLKDAAKEVVGLTAKKLSGRLNDVPLEALLTTDIGKLKKKHLLTSVQVEMDPITTGDKIKPDDPINRIKNPAGCVLLTAAAGKDEVPGYEITKIEPNLKWKDDDERIAWWILGGEAKADNQYDGKADFMNMEEAKRGKKIQVYGTRTGDVLIQPYSGGYGYGMYRAHVIPVKQMKYRLCRIFTKAQAAQAAQPAQAALPAQAAQPAFPGGGGVPAQPAVPNLAAVAARPAIPAVPARVAHSPTASQAEAKLHMKIVNIYLRQAGIEMIPDDSAEVARPALAARAALPAVAAQPAIAAEVATPAVPGVAARSAVPARPAVPAFPAVPAVAASVVNNKVGDPGIDAKIVSVTQDSPGHFDVEVNDINLVFNTTDPNAMSAIRINARNDVVILAYVKSGPAGVLANALLCPMNHAPHPRHDPPTNVGATSIFPDLGAPSTSLISKTGIPPDTPAGKVNMTVLGVLNVVWEGSSPANRNINLLWGAVVPTVNIDTSPTVKTAARVRLAYGNTIAHELCHVWGLGHRGPAGASVPDGLAVPPNENLMHGNNPPPQAENIDIIQVKAMRFAEPMFRTP